MPNINKTIYFDTNIEFIGHLNPSTRETVTENALSVAKNVFFSSDFINSATYTMACATVASALLKLWRIYVIRKEVRHLDKPEV